jgi:CheY-like chemotaxis protein
MGHRVTVVSNGRDAVRRAEANIYDVIIMDVQMPEMDGLEATKEIRAAEVRSGSARVPIVAMTAEALRGDRDRCIAAGMDAYVTKPFRIEELAMELARISRREDEDDSTGPITERSGRPEGALLQTSPTAVAVVPTKATPSVKPTAAGMRNFDLESALTRAAGEVELLREVVVVMLADVPSTLERIAAALGELDFERLRRLAHNLKGAAGNLGGERLAGALHALEQASMEKRADLAATANAEAVEAWRDLEAELVAWSTP